MRLTKEKKKALVIGISIFLILIGIISLAGLNKTFSIGDTQTFTPIFCNDYEFSCCNEVISSTQPSFKLTGTDVLQCPSTATKCSISRLTGTETIWVGENCNYVNLLLGWSCDSRVARQVPNFDIYPNQYIMTSQLVSATVKVDTYQGKLSFCGRSGCAVGVAVSGADQCKFNPPGSKIYTSSALTNPINTASYSVPIGNCILSWQGNDRHICGYKEESCYTDSDCQGTVCNARTKQTYGCKNYGTTIITHDTLDNSGSAGGNSLDEEKNSLNTFGKRCEIISAVQVQCCGDNDCGSSYRCSSSNTCVPIEQVECDENSDCGVSQVCDWTNNLLKAPICTAGKCSFKTEQVGCCLDANCPASYYCSIERKCEKSVTGLQLCPFECCVNDPLYSERKCSADKPNCVNNICSTTPSGSGSGVGGGLCESCDSFVRSNLLGWISPSTKCEKKFLQNNLTCAFSYFKIIAVILVLIFSLLVGKDLLSSFSALKNKEWLAWIIASIIAVSLAVLTYFIFIAGVIVAGLVILARFLIKRFLKI